MRESGSHTKLVELVRGGGNADRRIRVEKGEEIVITRRGKPVARLGPIRSEHDVAKARAAIEAIKEMRKGVTLGGLKIKDLIEEGRK